LANIIASRLRDKEVVTDTGVTIGELYDISMSESILAATDLPTLRRILDKVEA